MSDTPSDHEFAFDTATAIRPRPDGSTFDVDVHPEWTVGDKPNGGYLLALLGRAGRAAARSEEAHADHEVVASSITYLGAPDLTAAEIRTTVLRRGRTATHVRAVLVQGEAEMVDAVFVTGGLHAAAEPRYSDVPPLDAPGPMECIRLKPALPSGVKVGMLDCTELRLDPLVLPFGAPSAPGPAKAVLRGWTRFADGRESDPLSLLYFVDAIPPATFPLGSSGWVPTLQMSTYVRALPAPGWLGIRLEAHLVADQMVDETCTLWDADGRVVAQATQLARVRFPDETG